MKQHLACTASYVKLILRCINKTVYVQAHKVPKETVCKLLLVGVEAVQTPGSSVKRLILCGIESSHSLAQQGSETGS